MTTNKMNLLEEAMGLISNAQPFRDSEEGKSEWFNAQERFIAGYTRAIHNHETKHRNKKVSIGNEAIMGYLNAQSEADHKDLAWRGINHGECDEHEWSTSHGEKHEWSEPNFAPMVEDAEEYEPETNKYEPVGTVTQEPEFDWNQEKVTKLRHKNAELTKENAALREHVMKLDAAIVDNRRNERAWLRAKLDDVRGSI